MEVPQGLGARVPQTEEKGSQAASKCHLLHLGLWGTGQFRIAIAPNTPFIIVNCLSACTGALHSHVHILECVCVFISKLVYTCVC